MLDMHFIKTNAAEVERAIEVKGVSVELNELFTLDSQVRAAR